ncbi:MAG: hypothetical protein WBF34_10990, partial [Streptosporangiaceae bacterium]
GNGIFTTQDNVFRDNHYCVASAAHPNDGYANGWFAWMNHWMDATRQVPQPEAGGTFTIGTTCRRLLGASGLMPLMPTAPSTIALAET